MKRTIVVFNNRLFALCFRILYFNLSVYLWVYKKWAVNGDMNDMVHYITIIYCITASILAAVICPMDMRGEIWYVRGWELNKKRLLYISILSLYTGFAIGAYYALFNFSMTGIIKIILLGLWCFPLILTYIWLIEWLKEKVCVNRRQENKEDKYFFWKCFLLLFVVWNILYTGAWPGGLPYDANLEIDTALGNVPFSSWQPYIHVMIVRLALKLGGHISMFFMWQIALGAALLSGLLSFFYHKSKIKKKWMYCILVFLMLFPPIYTIVMILLRDPLFSMGFAWMFFLLLNYKREKIKGYYLQLFIALFIVATMRSNGIIPFLFLFPFLMVYGIKKDKHLCTIGITILLIFCVINGPLARYVGVEKVTSTNFAIQTAVDGFMSVKHYGGDLPDGVEKLMEEIKLEGIDDWTEGYSEQQFQRTYDATGVSTFKILDLYMKTFLKNPYLIIRNRLIKCSTIWEIFGHGESMVYRYLGVNTRNDYYFYLLDEREMSKVTHGIRAFIDGLNAEFLTYRSGIYLVFILIHLIYSDLKKRTLFACIPIFGNVIGLAYALGYHESRFVYWITLCWGILFLFEIFECSKKNEKLENSIIGSKAGA